MAYYVVNHKVSNFNVWKKTYDEFEETRRNYGVKEHFALQSVEDSNHVMVVGEGELEAINNFLNSEELKKGMSNAGISGPPNFFIGENKK